MSGFFWIKRNANCLAFCKVSGFLYIYINISQSFAFCIDCLDEKSDQILNIFNKINRTGMLWTVRNLWLSGSIFVLNCYRHWSLLVLWKAGGVTKYGCLRYMHPLTDQKPESVISWYHLALVCLQWRSTRYVCKSWVVFQFATTIKPGTGVFSRTL